MDDLAADRRLQRLRSHQAAWLLERGWPSRSLLLSAVVLPSGEHHLILVVRVKDVDLVLDNLNDDIRLAATPYGQYFGSNPIAAKSKVLAARALGRL